MEIPAVVSEEPAEMSWCSWKGIAGHSGFSAVSADI